MAKDLMKQIEETLGSKRKGSELFVPTPWYNSYGDCVEYKSVDEDEVAERVDAILTIYRSMRKPETIIGFQIKGVRALLREIETRRVDFLGRKKKASLTALLDEAYWQAGTRYEKQRHAAYRKIREMDLETDSVELGDKVSMA